MLGRRPPLADMDADGVDVQVVSPTPVFFNYDTPVGEAEKIARIFNDLALEICAPTMSAWCPSARCPSKTPTRRAGSSRGLWLPATARCRDREPCR